MAIDNYRLLQIGVYAQLSNMFFPIVLIRAFISRRADIQTRHREFLFRLIECRRFILLFREGDSLSVGLLLELHLRYVLDHRTNFGVFVDQIEATRVQRREPVNATLGPTKICEHLVVFRFVRFPRAAHERNNKEVYPVLLLYNIVLICFHFIRIRDITLCPIALRRINIANFVY